MVDKIVLRKQSVPLSTLLEDSLKDWQKRTGKTDSPSFQSETRQRWAVNYARHKLTNYDKILDRRYYNFAERSAFHKKVLTLIAQTWPELASECERQMNQFSEKDCPEYHRCPNAPLDEETQRMIYNPSKGAIAWAERVGLTESEQDLKAFAKNKTALQIHFLFHGISTYRCPGCPDKEDPNKRCSAEDFAQCDSSDVASLLEYCECTGSVTPYWCYPCPTFPVTLPLEQNHANL
jgi:hypothetical protein